MLGVFFDDDDDSSPSSSGDELRFFFSFFFSSSDSEPSDSDSDFSNSFPFGCTNQIRTPSMPRKLSRKNNCDVLNIVKLWKNPTTIFSDFSTNAGRTDF